MEATRAQMKADQKQRIDEIAKLQATFSQQMEGYFSNLRRTPLYFGGGTSGSSAPLAPQPLPSTPSVQQYNLRRTLNSVPEVCTEYEVGFAGCPAVKSLEEDHGTAWRQDPTNSRYFLRRKIQYEELERIALEDDVSLGEAARTLEQVRKRGSMSLATLTESIGKRNKRSRDNAV